MHSLQKKFFLFLESQSRVRLNKDLLELFVAYTTGVYVGNAMPLQYLVSVQLSKEKPRP